jgi:hypothetical protein
VVYKILSVVRPKLNVYVVLESQTKLWAWGYGGVSDPLQAHTTHRNLEAFVKSVVKQR